MFSKAKKDLTLRPTTAATPTAPKIKTPIPKKSTNKKTRTKSKTKTSSKSTTNLKVHNLIIDDFESNQVYNILDRQLESNEELLEEQNLLVEKYEKLCKRIFQEGSNLKHLNNDAKTTDYAGILEKKAQKINDSLSRLKLMGEELENIKYIKKLVLED